MYLRFITQTNRKSRTRCGGIFSGYVELRDSGALLEHDQAYGNSILEKLNQELPVPPFSSKNWEGCVCWFKDSAKETVHEIRELVQILSDYDIQVEMLKEEKPGMIVYEDAFQIVAKSKKY